MEPFLLVCIRHHEYVFVPLFTFLPDCKKVGVHPDPRDVRCRQGVQRLLISLEMYGVFCLLTNFAAANKLVDVHRHIWPPILFSYSL